MKYCLQTTKLYRNWCSTNEVPEVSQCREAHVVPEQSRDVLQLLDPLLPLPQAYLGGGHEAQSGGVPSAPCPTAAQHSQHAVRPQGFAQ